MSVVALIVAAGRGTRAAKAGAAPKQYRALGGMPMVAHSIGTFAEHPDVDAVAVVFSPDDSDLYAAASAPFATRSARGRARRRAPARLRALGSRSLGGTRCAVFRVDP